MAHHLVLEGVMRTMKSISNLRGKNLSWGDDPVSYWTNTFWKAMCRWSSEIPSWLSKVEKDIVPRGSRLITGFVSFLHLLPVSLCLWDRQVQSREHWNKNKIKLLDYISAYTSKWCLLLKGPQRFQPDWVCHLREVVSGQVCGRGGG